MAGQFLDLLRHALGMGPRDGIERQYGAIPWRLGAAGPEFLMITSRRTGRWIFPKGGRIAWLSARDSAAQEAWEEAGVEGEVGAEPLGRYRTLKVRPEGEVEIEVEMYPLAVEIELDDWPEKGQRERRWVAADVACETISEPGLVPMIKALAEGAKGSTPRGA